MQKFESCQSICLCSPNRAYRFVPIAVETLGAPGDKALARFGDLGQRITVTTAKTRSFQFLMHRF